ncbi:MAG: hypothetical protein IPJ17_10795 [Holophagales bacterium]|nr:MAG: hypothetical protein IPJ17_10795 [Holophagales bacterium]
MFRLPFALARFVGLQLLLTAAAPAAGPAAICNVPSVGYPTIAAALDDATCDPIQLAAGTIAENVAVSRSVSVVGSGSTATTLAGWLRVRGATTVLAIGSLRIDASAATADLCHASGLDARGGAQAAGSDLVVVGRPTPTASCGFFSDGFESGDLTPWSARRP